MREWGGVGEVEGLCRVGGWGREEVEAVVVVEGEVVGSRGDEGSMLPLSAALSTPPLEVARWRSGVAASDFESSDEDEARSSHHRLIVSHSAVVDRHHTARGEAASFDERSEGGGEEDFGAMSGIGEDDVVAGGGGGGRGGGSGDCEGGRWWLSRWQRLSSLPVWRRVRIRGEKNGDVCDAEVFVDRRGSDEWTPRVDSPPQVGLRSVCGT